MEALKQQTYAKQYNNISEITQIIYRDGVAGVKV